MGFTHSKTENEQNSNGESQMIQDCINEMEGQKKWSLFRALTDNDVFQNCKCIKNQYEV